MTNDIPRETKVAIIQQNILQHRNTIFDLNIKAIVAKKLGDTEEQIKPYRDQMERLEKAIVEFEKMLNEVAQ